MNENQSAIDKCHEFAKWLEDNPELPKITSPAFEHYYWDAVRAKEHVAAIARAGARSLLKVTKDYSSDYFRLIIEGNHFTLRVSTERTNVCTREQVGTEMVTRSQLPEGVEYVKVEVEEPVYEWSCDPILS